MIFVTVGTHEQPFNRLIQKVDELKRDGVIKDTIKMELMSIAALIAWWKNNSFTKEAIAADAEYDRLRKQNGK